MRLWSRLLTRGATAALPAAAGWILLITAGAGELSRTQNNSATILPEGNSRPPIASVPIVARPNAPQPSIGLPSDTHLDRTPPRTTKGLDLIKMGWTYDCMECHKIIQAKWHYDRPMVEHDKIKLNHGNNRFCLNCHHPTNRNAFVDYDGSEIAEANVVLLCAKCHGPTYRDWDAGVHGRRNGHWDPRKGPQTALRCIQCHDPHQPKFPSMRPLPPLRYPARAPHPKDQSEIGHPKPAGKPASQTKPVSNDS